MELKDWESVEEKKEISIADMTAAVEKLRETKNKYSESKKLADADYEAFKDAEATVLSMLEEAKLDTYIVKGIGRVTKVSQLSVQVPKTPEEKQAFLNWIKERMGDDGYWAYTTINSQSLNSLYKNLSAEYASRGEVLEIDGLQPATSFAKLSFTKA